MRKKIAIIGYGNIGKYALDAIKESEDFELSGIVRRNSMQPQPEELSNIKIVDDISKLENVEVAVLCTPTRSVFEYARRCLELGINTVDSFDIHTKIWDLKSELDPIAKKHNAVSIISAGWDPGSDSIVRTLMEACAPRGITYTNFGPGMSMGHSVAVKSIEGVFDALSMTIPLGTGIHRRIVYVQLDSAKNISFEEVSLKIKNDPYFKNDETHVIQVDNVKKLLDKGHGVNMTRKAVSGKTDNQLFEFNMKINNPALTAQIMIAAARATFKQTPGSYTMIEIPVINLLPQSPEEIIKKLV